LEHEDQPKPRLNDDFEASLSHLIGQLDSGMNSQIAPKLVANKKQHHVSVDLEEPILQLRENEQEQNEQRLS